MVIRAVYENGSLRLLDPVTLTPGQQVTVTIEPLTEQNVLRTVLGDLVRWADPQQDQDAWTENEAAAIDQAFQGLPPLSQIILEERGEA
jgi:predicted DNA-binding antitoxin AbrB/MazE fold protein